MSHYVNEKTSIKDKKCIIEALEDLGFTKIIDQENRHLIGYKGDVRNDTADITIDRSDVSWLSNDIGFQKQKDGTYSIILSEYDRGLEARSTGKMGDFTKNFKKAYANRMIDKQLKTSTGRSWRKTVTKQSNKTVVTLNYIG